MKIPKSVDQGVGSAAPEQTVVYRIRLLQPNVDEHRRLPAALRTNARSLSLSSSGDLPTASSPTRSVIELRIGHRRGSGRIHDGRLRSANVHGIPGKGTAQ